MKTIEEYKELIANGFYEKKLFDDAKKMLAITDLGLRVTRNDIDFECLDNVMLSHLITECDRLAVVMDSYLSLRYRELLKEEVWLRFRLGDLK